MRKSMLVLLCVALGIFLGSSVVIAGTSPGTGIKQTAHDLSSATGRGALWNAGTAADSLDRICIYCHAPHHTITPADAVTAGLTYYPLWNRQVTTKVYALYQNTDPLNPDVPNDISHQLNAALNQPGSVSKLCLSCHDGTLAVNQYGYYAPTGSSKFMGTKLITDQPRFAIGAGTTGLANHHPIGFDYGAVAAVDDEIKDAGATLLGSNPYGLTINSLLFGNKMECASCHDVHNTKNTGDKFTWVQDSGSNLCLSCHKK
jgi:predicted CXXCH cytochrome family protein